MSEQQPYAGRVVHLHRDGPVSGSERHLLTLLPGLRQLGVDVHFLSLRSAAGPAALERGLVEAGVPCSHVPPRKHLDPRGPRDVRRQLLRLQPDLVHTHLIHADVWGAAAGASLRLPCVATAHAVHNAHLNQMTESALRVAWHRARAVVAVSDFVAAYLRSRRLCPPERIHVIKHGLLPVHMAPRASSASGWRSADGPRVLVASRLIPHKGHAVLLQAWAAVSSSFPDAMLLVAGDGPLRAELEALCARLELSGRVRFLGYVPDMEQLYQEVDAVVFPTEEGFGEGFGLVNLEAMQQGLPVIGSDRPPIPEIVVDGVTGRLVPPGDAAALAEVLQELLGDADSARRWGEAGAERARSEFSATTMTRRTTELYAAVTKGAA